MTYEEYTNARQKEWDALPIFYAFGQAQFEEALKERGYKKKDYKDLVNLGHGAFCHRSALPAIKAFTEADRLAELMQDYDFAYDAVYYEMANHEYHINLQGDYDVCSCFGAVGWHEDDAYTYFKELGWSADTVRAYACARRDFLDNAKY